MEFFTKEWLASIGNLFGKTLIVDHTTLNIHRSQSAQTRVEIDLSKPLQSKFYFRGKLRHIQYKGLHAICFTYGNYGHRQEYCPTTQAEQEKHTDQNNGTTSPSPN